jgi:quinoprotein glucose dehydrogenase
MRMRTVMKHTICTCAVVLWLNCLATSVSIAAPGIDGEWQHYGNTLGGTRFSPLTQITPDNVASLERAWIYRTDVAEEKPQRGVEVTPLMVGGRLFLCTQTNVVIALDPETGRPLWSFDPHVDSMGVLPATACRGVAWFHTADPAAECPDRILTSTFDARLIALDARTGQPCRSFGDEGTVHLKSGLGEMEPGLGHRPTRETR